MKLAITYTRKQVVALLAVHASVLGQTELARHAGVPVQTIHAILKRGKSPSPKVLRYLELEKCYRAIGHSVKR